MSTVHTKACCRVSTVVESGIRPKTLAVARAALFCTECERDKDVTGTGGSHRGAGLPRTTRLSLVSGARAPDLPGVPVPAVSALERGQHPAWAILRTVDMDDVPLVRRLGESKEATAVAIPPASPRWPSRTCSARVPSSLDIRSRTRDPATAMATGCWPGHYNGGPRIRYAVNDRGPVPHCQTDTGGRACILTPLDTKEGEPWPRTS